MTSQNLVLITLPTVTNLSTSQYCAVRFDSAGNAVLAVAGKNATGILQNTPDGTSDKSAGVAVSGKSKAAITDTIVIGAPLEVGVGGTLVNHGSGTVVAFAMEAGITGGTISVLMTPNNGLLA